MAGIYDILDRIKTAGGMPPEYYEKQIHKVPDADVVDRVGFLMDRCAGKVVLDIGYASGDLHAKIVQVAREVYGIDRDLTEGANGLAVTIDLDLLCWPPKSLLPWRDKGIEVVVMGELLEHLVNPGHVLDYVRESYPEAELIVTAPNAYCGHGWMQRGIENVNRDHVAWYSWWTLRRLLEKTAYEVTEFHWYNGKPLWAEGMIMVAGTAASGEKRSGDPEKESTE